eukprot:1739551-Pleurochrysis_carterae.AAC.1
MQQTTNHTPTVSTDPSWDCSHITIRAWADELLTWLPTENASYAPLIEHGYIVTTQGRVVVANHNHAIAVCHRIFNPYPLHAPSPTDPHYDLTISTLPPAVQTRTRAAAAQAAATAAGGSTQPTTLTLPSDQADRFIVSPEMLANVDRQLMESILRTMDSLATRQFYRNQCNSSGRNLIRIIIQHADNAPASAGMAIEAMMQAHFENGL